MIPEHIKQLLIDKYDPEDIVDILGFDTEELIEQLDQCIMDNLDKFDIEY